MRGMRLQRDAHRSAIKCLTYLAPKRGSQYARAFKLFSKWTFLKCLCIALCQGSLQSHCYVVMLVPLDLRKQCTVNRCVIVWSYFKINHFKINQNKSSKDLRMCHSCPWNCLYSEKLLHYLVLKVPCTKATLLDRLTQFWVLPFKQRNGLLSFTKLNYAMVLECI